MQFLSFTMFLTMISTLLFFASSLGLKAYNNSLSVKEQEMEGQVVSMQTQNGNLEVEIRQLASADRVNQVAANDGMTYNQNSITTVTATDAKN